MASEFVSSIGQGLGHKSALGKEIIVTIYGPRGGLAATQSVSIEQAKEMSAQLATAIATLESIP
jgi:hypothetical protein